jgi:hypothetical protein
VKGLIAENKDNENNIDKNIEVAAPFAYCPALSKTLYDEEEVDDAHPDAHGRRSLHHHVLSR